MACELVCKFRWCNHRDRTTWRTRCGSCIAARVGVISQKQCCLRSLALSTVRNHGFFRCKPLLRLFAPQCTPDLNVEHTPNHPPQSYADGDWRRAAETRTESPPPRRGFGHRRHDCASQYERSQPRPDAKPRTGSLQPPSVEHRKSPHCLSANRCVSQGRRCSGSPGRRRSPWLVVVDSALPWTGSSDTLSSLPPHTLSRPAPLP